MSHCNRDINLFNDAPFILKGFDGKSAYELAVSQGYKGSLEDWLKDLQGLTGVTFIPHVSESGELTWTNDGGLENPDPVNIKGERGDKGDPGSPSNLRYFEGKLQYYDEESESWITIYEKEKDKMSEKDLAIYSQNYDINAVDLKIPGSVEYVKDYQYRTGSYDSRMFYSYGNGIIANTNMGNYNTDRSAGFPKSSRYDLQGNEIVQPSLRHVIFEEGVKQVGVGAFEGQSNLDRIEFPESLEWVHPTAFYNTRWMNQQPYGPIYCGPVLYQYKHTTDSNPRYTLDRDLVVKQGTKTISSQAFLNNNSSRTNYSDTIRGFRSITLPDTLIGIGDYAFCGIGYYNSVEMNELPDSVSWVGKYAFYESRLRFTKLPLSLEKLQERSFEGNNFSGCKVKIPDKVKVVEHHAMSSCHIKELDLNNVELIGNDAFYNNDIEELIIPETVQDVSYNSFSYCTSLVKVHIPSSVKSLGSSPFSGCTSLKEVTVGYGFSVPRFELPNNVVFSADVLETIIANLGDRTGLSTGYFVVGSSNRSRISSASITEASNKNWTIS